MTVQAVPCRIYLIVDAGPAALDKLTAVLAVVPVASVLIAPVPGQALTVALARPLVALVQTHNIAALLADDVDLARTLRADGVHLKAGNDCLERYQSARARLGAAVSIGVDAGGSRHYAMELGEAGADYIGFGNAVVDTATPEDEVAGPATPAELVAWWSVVFEVPCVAFDLTGSEATADAAATGADFVAIALPIGQTTAAVVAHVRAVHASLGAVDAT